MASALRCKECGETSRSMLQIDPTGKYFTCQQCGTVNQIFDEWVIHEHTHSIKGVQGAQEYLDRAEQNITDRKYDAALNDVKRAIELEPRNHRAWWLRYSIEMVVAAYYNYEDQYGNCSVYTKTQIIARNLNQYAYRAIEYAPQDVADEYRRAIADDEQFVLSNQNAKPQKTKSQKNGCYIATAVYGSYQAPQVMTLRRYRDQVLRQTVAGRLFIRCYYAISPHLAKHLAAFPRLNRAVKHALDRMVERLEA